MSYHQLLPIFSRSITITFLQMYLSTFTKVVFRIWTKVAETHVQLPIKCPRPFKYSIFWQITSFGPFQVTLEEIVSLFGWLFPKNVWNLGWSKFWGQQSQRKCWRCWRWKGQPNHTKFRIFEKVTFKWVSTFCQKFCFI